MKNVNKSQCHIIPFFYRNSIKYKIWSNIYQIKNFNYITLHYNKLLIIDALMDQGSYPRYSLWDQMDGHEKFIYSEHSGVITVKNDSINNIIVSAETNRIDATDKNIYLPIN